MNIQNIASICFSSSIFTGILFLICWALETRMRKIRDLVWEKTKTPFKTLPPDKFPDRLTGYETFEMIHQKSLEVTCLLLCQLTIILFKTMVILVVVARVLALFTR